MPIMQRNATQRNATQRNATQHNATVFVLNNQMTALCQNHCHPKQCISLLNVSSITITCSVTSTTGFSVSPSIVERIGILKGSFTIKQLLCRQQDFCCPQPAWYADLYNLLSSMKVVHNKRPFGNTNHHLSLS